MADQSKASCVCTIEVTPENEKNANAFLDQNILLVKRNFRKKESRDRVQLAVWICLLLSLSVRKTDEAGPHLFYIPCGLD